MRIAHCRCNKCNIEFHQVYTGGFPGCPARPEICQVGRPADPLCFGQPSQCPKCGSDYFTWLNYPPEEEENICRICVQYAQRNLKKQ